MYKSVLFVPDTRLRLFLNFEDILENDLEMLYFADVLDFSDFTVSMTMISCPPSKFSLVNYLDIYSIPISFYSSIWLSF